MGDEIKQESKSWDKHDDTGEQTELELVGICIRK